MFLCRVFFGAEAAAPPRWQGNVPDRGHLQEHIYRNKAAPKNTEKKMNLTTKTKLTGTRQTKAIYKKMAAPKNTDKKMVQRQNFGCM